MKVATAETRAAILAAYANVRTLAMRISDPWKDPIEPGDAFAMRDGSVIQVQGVVGRPPNVSVDFVVNRYAQYGDDAVHAVLKPQDMDIRQFMSWVRNEEPGRR